MAFFKLLTAAMNMQAPRGLLFFRFGVNVWCMACSFCCNVESGCIARSSKWFFLVLNVVIFERTKEQGNILAFTCHEHMQ